jgi:hypothetical protein
MPLRETLDGALLVLEQARLVELTRAESMMIAVRLTPEGQTRAQIISPMGIALFVGPLLGRSA